jgi:hypothetical protein
MSEEIKKRGRPPGSGKKPIIPSDAMNEQEYIDIQRKNLSESKLRTHHNVPNQDLIDFALENGSEVKDVVSSDKNSPFVLPDGKFIDIEDLLSLLENPEKNIDEKYRYVSVSTMSSLVGMAGTNIHTNFASGKLNKKLINNLACIDLYDKRNIEWVRTRNSYLNNRIKANTRYRKGSEEEDSGGLNRLEKVKLKKEEAAVRLHEIKIQKELNKLLEKELVLDVFKMMGKSVRELIFPIPERISPQVAAICGSTNTEHVLKINTELRTELNRFLEEFIKLCETELSNIDVDSYISEIDNSEE